MAAKARRGGGEGGEETGLTAVGGRGVQTPPPRVTPQVSYHHASVRSGFTRKTLGGARNRGDVSFR